MTTTVTPLLDETNVERFTHPLIGAWARQCPHPDQGR